MIIALKTASGRFLTAENGGGKAGIPPANRDSAKPGDWERFRIHQRPNGKIALESSGGRFVSAQLGGGGDLLANRVLTGTEDAAVPDQLKTAIHIWEEFDLIGSLKEGASIG